jgi:hypothetical protein
MPENSFELIKKELPTGEQIILSRVLEGLSPAELDKLREKAAEGKMALELEQLSKVHQFHASSADMQQFIENVKSLEWTHRRAFSTYKAEGTFKTATGTTTIQSAKGRCFVATAVYGDASHPDVMLLRAFRDSVLRCSIGGRLFIQCYEQIGPHLARSAITRGAGKYVLRWFFTVVCKLLSLLMRPTTHQVSVTNERL